MDYDFFEDEERLVIIDESGEMAGELLFSLVESRLIVVDRTTVSERHRGQGLAEELVRMVVEKARREKKKILPLCPFTKLEFMKKVEYADVAYRQADEGT